MGTIDVAGNSSPLPAWAAPGAAGISVTTGPSALWRMTSTGGRGYVADGLAWQEPPGRYEAQVTLSATGPVNVEVWNDTGDTLLARRTIMATTGIEPVTVGVDATTAYRARPYPGWGPFRGARAPPPSALLLDVSLWSPARTPVTLPRAHPSR